MNFIKCGMVDGTIKREDMKPLHNILSNWLDNFWGGKMNRKEAFRIRKILI